MTHVYQMFDGGVDVDASEMFTFYTGRFQCARFHNTVHIQKLNKPNALSRVRQNAFAVYITNSCN